MSAFIFAKKMANKSPTPRHESLPITLHLHPRHLPFKPPYVNPRPVWGVAGIQALKLIPQFMKNLFKSIVSMFRQPVEPLPDYLLRHFKAQDRGDFDWKR